MDIKLLERQFADAQALKLSDEAYRRWAICLSGHRFMAWEMKEIVIYTLLLGGPVVQDVISLSKVEVDFEEGLSTTWWSRKHGTIKIGQVPTEVAHNCFIWHNQHTMLEYTRHHSNLYMRFAMSWRTYRNPKTLEEDTTYLLEKAAFDDFNWTVQ